MKYRLLKRVNRQTVNILRIVFVLCLFILAWTILDNLDDITNVREDFFYISKKRDAASLIQKGEHQRARALLNKMLHNRPTDPESWRMVAESFEQEGYATAGQAYYRSVILDRGCKKSAVSCLRSILLSPVDKIEEIIATEVVQLFPHDPEVLYLFYQVMVSANRFKDADSVITDLIRMFPNNKIYYNERISLRARGKGPSAEQARKHLASNQQIKLETDEAFWILQATAFSIIASSSDKEEKRNAIKLLENALNLRPDDWLLRFRKFSVVREHAPELVISEMDNLLKAIIDSEKPGLLLNVIRRVSDLAPTALSLVRKLPTSVRNEAESVLLEIELLVETNAWADIITLSERLYDSEEVNPYHRFILYLWNARALSATEAGDSKVKAICDRALTLASNQFDRLLALRGAFLMDRFQMNEIALLFFQQASLTTGEVRNAALRGISMRPEKIPEQNLLDIFKELHAYNPTDPNIAVDGANALLERRTDLLAALALSEFAYNRQPQNIYFADTYARALIANNRRREALEVYEAMPKSAFDDRRIRTNMETLRMMGTGPVIPRVIEPVVLGPGVITDEKDPLIEEVLANIGSEPEKSLAIAKRLFNNNSRNIWNIHALALSLSALNQIDEAVSLLTSQVLQALPKYPIVLLDFTEILIKAKSYSMALEILDKISPEELDSGSNLLHQRLKTTIQQALLAERE